MTSDIVLLAVSIGFLCFLASSARSGVIGLKGGSSVRRDQSPFAFWFFAFLLGLLGVMFLIQAVVGIMKNSR
jgi:hypothetical protein